MTGQVEKFIKDQLSVWPLASENYRDLKKVAVKTLKVGGLDVLLQHNPCRTISSDAATDPASIAARPCFLCPENRPPEQYNIEFEGRKGKMYRVTLNPFPIFPRHLVISSFRHLPQAIWKRYQDMLDFVREIHFYFAWLDMVKTMAEWEGLPDVSDEKAVQELLAEARKWAIRHGGVSGRTAKQFIHYIAGR